MNQDHWIHRLKQMWNSGGDGGKKKVSPLQKMVLIFLVGLAIMILASYVQVEKQTTAETPASPEPQPEPAFASPDRNYSIEDIENMYETELKEMLETVVGVGEVEVMVNLDSTDEVVIAMNRNHSTQTTKETDKNSGTRNISEESLDEQVVLIQENKGDQPVVIKTVKPKVRGVLVVAKGAEHMQVKAWIAEAVQRVLDVPPHKISILPKKG